MTKRLVRTMLCTGVFALALGAAASAANFAPGSPGLGDPMFPNAGNGGYDVQHYGLTLDYTPSSIASAIPLLRRAIELDPRYAVAYATLGLVTAEKL